MKRYTYHRVDNYQGQGVKWVIYLLRSDGKAEPMADVDSEEFAWWLVKQWNQNVQENVHKNVQ